MKLILIGPPGAGKDTQAKFLKKRYNLEIISAGDIIREEIKNKTKEGLIFKEYYEKGEIFSGEILNNLVNKKIEKKENFILNGYPRNIEQAKSLKTEIDFVICISSSKENIMKRLLGRGRSDDVKDVIEHRIKVYDRETKPLLEFYKKNLIRVNGNIFPRKVFNFIVDKIDRNLKIRT